MKKIIENVIWTIIVIAFSCWTAIQFYWICGLFVVYQYGSLEFDILWAYGNGWIALISAVMTAYVAWYGFEKLRKENAKSED